MTTAVSTEQLPGDVSRRIADTLRPLGITRNMKAYGILTGCLLRVLEREERLEAVQKEIYEPLALEKGYDWSAVQSTVRRAAQTAWTTNPTLLQQMAGYPLTGCPAAVQFLEMLYNHVVRSF